MKSQRLPLSAIEPVLRSLVGQPLTHVGRGEGQAIFIEVGLLRPSLNTKGNYFVRGERSIILEGGWRVEKTQSVWFGAMSDQKTIDSLLPKLLGQIIEAASCTGRLPELCLTLSGDLWLSSFFCGQGPQKWSIISSGQVYRAKAQNFYREEES